MRVDAIAGISFGLTAAVVCNAFYKKEQFYPSVVYLTKSNPSMAIIYIQALVLVVLFGKLLRKIFFGQLRAAETEHLIERSWYAVTETCLAFTVFRDDFSPRFIALFTVLLFLKCFHWLVEDRVDFMERSPVISVLFHARAVLLLTLLSALDAFFIHHAYHSTLIKGASVQLVFGFEYAILLTVVVMIGVKYVLHTVDLQRENPWENKSVYLLYTELCLGFAKVVLYILFMGIMIKVHTLPLFAIRPMYLTTRAFKKAVHDVIMSRRAIRNMNSLYPNATAEDFESADNVCIICREEMHPAPAAAPGAAARAAANNGGAKAKKLPCGHIFHINCLRSWFQRQQTCPTCRIDILRQPTVTVVVPGNRDPNEAAARAAAVLDRARAAALAAAAVPNRAPAGGAPAAAAPAPGAPNGNQHPALFAAFFRPPIPPPPPTAAGANNAPTPPFPAFPFPPPFLFPPFPPQLSPPSTTDLSSLTEDQLRATESEERSRVEARIHVLRNIQTLLDSAVRQMNLYVASTTPAAPNAAAAATTSDDVGTAATTSTTSTTSTVSTGAADANSSTTTTSSMAAAGGAASSPAPPTADSGAVPKLPPKLYKAASTETSSKVDVSGENCAAAAAAAAQTETEKLGCDSKEEAGEGDAGKNEAGEIRRRRLQKLGSEQVSSASSCDKAEESKE